MFFTKKKRKTTTTTTLKAKTKKHVLVGKLILKERKENEQEADNTWMMGLLTTPYAILFSTISTSTYISCGRLLLLLGVARQAQRHTTNKIYCLHN